MPHSINYRIFNTIAVFILFILFLAAPGNAGTVRQQVFDSPEGAVKVLVDATERNDSKQLSAVFGPKWQDLLLSGEEGADNKSRERFLQAYREGSKLEYQRKGKVILTLGKDNWPFPVPMVKKGKSWRFDTRAGREEIVNRRIGRNELSVIEAMKAYVDAQKDYFSRTRNSDGVHEFARKIVSEKGKKDGLYWEIKDGEEQSPLGPFYAAAAREGYTPDRGDKKPVPYHGYYFKILTAQGKHAPGGAYDYIINKHMIFGFALIAYPAKYGASGVKTFLINQQGIVYERDLGKNTEQAASALNNYDPDKKWQAIK